MNQGSKPNAPDEKELTKRAIDLISKQSTMTLATAAQENTTWAAPVYYVFYDSAFYFFSNPQSLHIQQAATNDAVSAAIHTCADTWQEIQGMQMSGNIRNVRPGITDIHLIKAYLKKFPFTKELFEPGQVQDLAAFTERFKVKFYRFEPDKVFYLDNRIRFGFRAEVKLES
jgi:uncharacterized protein YhbP (UPF0306 family)